MRSGSWCITHPIMGSNLAGPSLPNFFSSIDSIPHGPFLRTYASHRIVWFIGCKQHQSHVPAQFLKQQILVAMDNTSFTITNSRQNRDCASVGLEIQFPPLPISSPISLHNPIHTSWLLVCHYSASEACCTSWAQPKEARRTPPQYLRGCNTTLLARSRHLSKRQPSRETPAHLRDMRTAPRIPVLEALPAMHQDTEGPEVLTPRGSADKRWRGTLMIT